jgi:hypothetical protein
VPKKPRQGKRGFSRRGKPRTAHTEPQGPPSSGRARVHSCRKSLRTQIASVGRTLLSNAFDFDLDLADDEQDGYSTVEERLFNAA